MDLFDVHSPAVAVAGGEVAPPPGGDSAGDGGVASLPPPGFILARGPVQDPVNGPFGGRLSAELEPEPRPPAVLALIAGMKEHSAISAAVYGCRLTI